MKKPFVDIILSFAKYLIIVLIPHLYMVLCAVVYHEIEGYDAVKHPPNQVEHFLLNNGINRQANTTEYMNNFKLALKQDEYWKTRNLFNSIAKSYMYVLSLFTTIGHQRMYIQTKDSRIFFIFTTPLGVILYYVALHYVAKNLLNDIIIAVMLIIRYPDNPWSDKQREIWVKVKAAIATLMLVFISTLLLALVFLVKKSDYINELYNVLQLTLTIGSIEGLLSGVLEDDTVHAVIISMVYFIALLYMYIFLYSAIKLFHTHKCKDIISLATGETIYAEVRRRDR